MAKSRKGEVRSVSFEPAKGGLISRTAMRYHRGGQGGGPEYDHEEETAVHSTMKHAAAHLHKVLGHHFGDEESGLEPEHGEGQVVDHGGGKK